MKKLLMYTSTTLCIPLILIAGILRAIGLVIAILAKKMNYHINLVPVIESIIGD